MTDVNFFINAWMIVLQGNFNRIGARNCARELHSDTGIRRESLVHTWVQGKFVLYAETQSRFAFWETPKLHLGCKDGSPQITSGEMYFFTIPPSILGNGTHIARQSTLRKTCSAYLAVGFFTGKLIPCEYTVLRYLYSRLKKSIISVLTRGCPNIFGPKYSQKFLKLLKNIRDSGSGW